MAIAELPHAVLHEVSVNEIALDQRESDTEPGQPSHNDPVAFRFGAFAPKEHPSKFYIAKISLDVLSRKDGKIHRAEAGFIKLAIDETIDNDGKPKPHIAIFLSQEAGTSGDEDDPVLVITRRGYLLNVPWLNAPMMGGWPRGFRSDDGRYHYNVQGDPTPDYPHGRIVQYDRHGSDDPAQWTPVAILKPEAMKGTP